MKNIVLIGFMASGKTTVGKLLSDLLNYRFYDTDLLIEKNEGKSIEDIFKIFGEEYFRNLETKTVKDFCDVDTSVIATGGGIVLNPENIDILRKNSVIVHLKTNDLIIKKRYKISKDARPLMKNQCIDDVLKRYKEREVFYKNCDFEIDLALFQKPIEIAEEIIRKMKERGDL